MSADNVNHGATPEIAPVIPLTGLTKHFSTEDVDTHALRDIDLQGRKGEFVAITGSSGCGKTTLMAVPGLLEPNKDTILFRGIDIRVPTSAVRVKPNAQRKQYRA